MFITFEGIDGCGKTTQLQLLAEYLAGKGKSVITVREPGGTEFSERIRELLLHSEYKLNSLSELMLFEAARADLTEKIIRPALSENKFILSDRFFDSTTAYQGYGRGLDLEAVKRINLFATEDLKPDISFYLKLSLNTSNQRTQDKKLDKIENSGMAFYNRLLNGFDAIAKSEPDRFIIIDAERSISDINKDVISHISKRIE